MLLTAVLLAPLCNAQNSIYPEKPDLVNIWHRVGDHSHQLRSVEAAELSPDGKLAVSASKFGYKIMMWRVADGTLLWETRVESEVECITFSPDDSRLATGDEAYQVRLWDSKTGEALCNWEHDSGIDGIAWSNNGAVLAAGTESGLVVLYDPESHEKTGELKVGSTVNSIQFTADDSQFIIGGNVQTKNSETGKVDYTGFGKLVSVKDLKVIVEYGEHKASVKSIRMSPDQRFVATGAFDNRLRVFDMQTGKLLKEHQNDLKIEAVAFTPDGQFLVSGGHQRSIDFYSTKDWELVYQLPSARTEYIDFSHDSRLMLTGHEDSGLLSLYLFVSDYQNHPNYHKIANEQLNNRDLKEQ